MAKAKRAAPKCPTGAVFTRGSDSAFTCALPSGENALRYEMKRPKAGTVARPAAFDYWTASAVPKTSAKERETCLTEVVKYVGKTKGQKTEKTKAVRLPFRCPPGAELRRPSKGSTGSAQCFLDGKKVEPVRDWSCGPSGTACGTLRETCPVQFVWKAGKPHLRFCRSQIATSGTKTGKPIPVKGPGYLFPVTSVEEAVRLSEGACSRWRENDYKLAEDDPVVLLAKRSDPASGGLGRAKRGRKKARR